ncbi:AraC family ligand binding domain-containing protein [Paenibacillus sp. 2TAB19]|jgi:AraC-like DNA-binding protein|uniref:AraC family transcriptional regulator n=1 Tax=Paenibacillus sp. 2TAB19 TaxID=3233003 RepID=UPI003F96CC54
MQQEMYVVASNPVHAQGEHARLNVLFAGESQTKPSHRLGPKVYDFYLMHIVLEGEGVFQLEGKRHSLAAGDTFLIEPKQLISYESDSANPWRYRWVAFSGEHAAELVAAAGFQADQQVIGMAKWKRAALLFRRIYQTFKVGGADAQLSATGHLHLLLAEYMKALHAAGGDDSVRTAHGQGDLLLQQMIHYLSSQYTHPVSIEQMAESLGYNRAYLSRFFKQRTGVSPVTFLLKLRIDKARHMLRERPELTVEQISASVGLQDALYFSKQFRKLYGQSPTAYRDSMRSMRQS